MGDTAELSCIDFSFDFTVCLCSLLHVCVLINDDDDDDGITTTVQNFTSHRSAAPLHCKTSVPEQNKKEIHSKLNTKPS